VQGGVHDALRRECAERLAAMRFDGYALGGLSVGEPAGEMYRILETTTPRLPAGQPRYLMGVGTPPQIVEAVARGIDLFDCVLPTRMARNGAAFTARGVLSVKAARFKDDLSPIEAGCGCYACTHFTRAYIRHLINVNEILAARLMTTHNLHFYLGLMGDIRRHLESGTFQAFRQSFVAGYGQP